MDLRRKETKLNVITSGASRRGQHTPSHSVGNYFYSKGSVTTQPQRGSLASTSGVPIHPQNQYRDIPPTLRPAYQAQIQQPVLRNIPPTLRPSYQAQSQQPILRNTEASTSHYSKTPSVVFLLDRSTFAELPETPNDNSVLRRKGHIRRRHRRAISDEPVRRETDLSDDLGNNSGALTPLMESVAAMYSGPAARKRRSSYTDTTSSPGLEEDLDSPSVYSPSDDDDERLREEEFLSPPFVRRGADALRDWTSDLRDWDATKDEVSEGRLLPKRVVTVHLKALLRRRREEAGLPDGVPDSPDDC